MGTRKSRHNRGRKVVYRRPYCKIEEGFITSFNEKYVFVRYGIGSTSQATERQDLEFISSPEINSMEDMLFTTRTDLDGPLDEIRSKFPEDEK